MDTVLHQEEQNRKIGLTVSIVLHAALMLFALLNLFTFPTPPPGQPSVAISFGAPDVGQGEEEPAPAQLADATETEEAAAEPAEVEEPVEEVKEKEVKTKPKPKKTKPKETKPSKVDTKKITDESNTRKIAAAKKKKAAEAAAAKKKAQEEAAAAEAAAAAAAKKAKADAAAAKAKAKEDAKNKFKDAFSGGQGSSGNSQGNSGTSGNAGNPTGDPDATVLSGEGTGNGDVEGFGGRGYTPGGPVQGNFQETGKIRLKVCVDSNGKVISTKQTQKGSTSFSSKLKKLAIANAKKYRFEKSDEDSQCGYITYIFKLQ